LPSDDHEQLKTKPAPIWRASIIDVGEHEPLPLERLEEEFLKHGMQYYVAAKSAAVAGLLPVTGNLYHHALEMLLKAGLSRTVPVENFRSSFGHRLNRIWEAFKVAFPSSELNRFDSTISDVDRWEKIRYPEEMLRTGAQISIEWADTPSNGSSPTPPIYKANGSEIDNPVIVLFEILSRNPSVFYPYYNVHAREAITRYHYAPERMIGPMAQAADNSRSGASSGRFRVLSKCVSWLRTCFRNLIARFRPSPRGSA
jgi:hypothetical protein